MAGDWILYCVDDDVDDDANDLFWECDAAAASSW